MAGRGIIYSFRPARVAVLVPNPAEPTSHRHATLNASCPACLHAWPQISKQSEAKSNFQPIFSAITSFSGMTEESGDANSSERSMLFLNELLT